MTEHHVPLRQPFRAGGADEVLRERFGDLGSVKPRDDRRASEAQGEGRQHQVMQAVGDTPQKREGRVDRRRRSTHGEPTEPLPEHEHHHEAEPEDRHGKNRQRGRRERVIESGIRRGALGRADHDPHRETDAECRNREKHGVGQGLTYDLAHRSVKRERLPEVATCDVGEITEILPVERPVEPPIATVLGDDLR